ncbi:MAG TPA: class I SAM-dependent methyltransferase [Solirubrobacterales bacterium]|nr:class I SAM-dependent methyltransferase [Solirubrobacterales bacterium]
MSSSAEDTSDSAKIAYEAFAAAYDDFTHEYQNERWTLRLLTAAQELGLRGDRLLDVGCGTGKSFIPMLERGWRVTGCDVSPAMVELARDKVGEEVELGVADMRELPVLGEFDLVWALDDAVNYLLSLEELDSALAGMRDNLAPGGFLVFDVNTLMTFQTFFCSEHVVEHGGRRMVWSGELSPEMAKPGCTAQATLRAADDSMPPHVHRQRHFGEAEVLDALDRAGLECRAIRGELDGDLSDGVDEAVHSKAVYFCTRAD